MRPGEEAEAAIRRIVAEQAAAWNAGDGTAYARAFAVDGSFTNIYGQSATGHAAFEQRHVHILSTFFRGSVLGATIVSLRFPEPRIAVVETDTEVSRVGEMPAGIRLGRDGVLRTRLLQVYALRDGEWKIIAHHNVAIQTAKLIGDAPRMR